jgi:hypothetical protein
VPYPLLLAYKGCAYFASRMGLRDAPPSSLSSRAERPDFFFRAEFWRVGSRSRGIPPFPRWTLAPESSLWRARIISTRLLRPPFSGGRAVC